MNCGKCGKELENDWTFCPYCSHRKINKKSIIIIVILVIIICIIFGSFFIK